MSSAGSHKLLQVSSHHFGQYWQFMSDIIISHACEDDIMFTCTLSGYSSPERVNPIQWIFWVKQSWGNWRLPRIRALSRALRSEAAWWLLCDCFTVLMQEGLNYQYTPCACVLARKDVKRNLIYRSGTVNSNTVNSKFHLIRSFFEYLARFLSFHV